jgi:hypothetical protein
VVLFKMTDGELVFAFRGTAAAPGGGAGAVAGADEYDVQVPLSSMLGMKGRYPEEVKVNVWHGSCSCQVDGELLCACTHEVQ